MSLLVKKRLEYFKENFEKLESRAKEKWRVFYQDELIDEELLQANTIYFVITGEEKKKKQKNIDFSIFYCRNKRKDELLDFSQEVKEFIKYLRKEFETNNFICIDNSYKISYSSTEKNTLRLAEIQCSYDCTKEILDEEKFMNMEKLENKIIPD